MEKQNKVIIIEPSEIIRKALIYILQGSEFEVIHEFPDYISFLKQHNSANVDLIVVNPMVLPFQRPFSPQSFFPDYSSAVFVGIVYVYTLPEIIRSFYKVITLFDEPALIINKLKCAVIEKNSSTIRKKRNSASGDLTKREKEILIHIVKGMTNKEIAACENISIHTVISHRKNIIRKTGIKTVPGLLIYAQMNHLISPQDFF